MRFLSVLISLKLNMFRISCSFSVCLNLNQAFWDILWKLLEKVESKSYFNTYHLFKFDAISIHWINSIDLIYNLIRFDTNFGILLVHHACFRAKLQWIHWIDRAMMLQVNSSHKSFDVRTFFRSPILTRRPQAIIPLNLSQDKVKFRQMIIAERC